MKRIIAGAAIVLAAATANAETIVGSSLNAADEAVWYVDNNNDNVPDVVKTIRYIVDMKKIVIITEKEITEAEKAAWEGVKGGD